MNEIIRDSFQLCFPFWKTLQPEQELYLLNQTKILRLLKGTSIYNGDETCNGIFLIKKGAIRVYILSEDGRDITLYRLSAGEVGLLSCDSVLTKITFDVNIEVEVDAELFLIPISPYIQINNKNLHVSLYTYQLSATRFSDIMWTLQEILFLSFDRRLAGFFLRESERVGSNRLFLTHDQIAKYVGSAREVVSRMCKYFVKEGIISTERGEINILDKQRLIAIAGSDNKTADSASRR